jgi:allantoate deiminase
VAEAPGRARGHRRGSRDAGHIATVGHLQVFPDAVNIIPGRAEFSVDLRGRHDEERDAAWQQIELEIAAICERRGLSFTFTQTHAAPAAHCSPRLRGAVAEGIRFTGDLEPIEILSWAGHDAMAVESVTEIAMLFVRCKGGVSHHPDEFVTEADVAAGLDAFEAAVRAVAAGYAPAS